ncbi:hypothetical protein [Alteromonas sp. CYL-A6]|uniref:hypothetical protein n=1 Tax=Alteromonas nitratireducens TaxID=3390813 RepID=UPI0034A83D33
MKCTYTIIFAGLLVTGVAGCDNTNTKTASMVRRDNAIAEASALLEKATTMTTPSVLSAPAEHLDDLIVIQDLLMASRDVFIDARIQNWDTTRQEQLEATLRRLNPALASASLDAYEKAIEKSLAFKLKKEKVESLPVYDTRIARQALYDELNQFNSELTLCCVHPIRFMQRFLASEPDKYQAYMLLTRAVLDDMGRLIRNEISARDLHDQVRGLRRALNEKPDSQ